MFSRIGISKDKGKTSLLPPRALSEMWTADHATKQVGILLEVAYDAEIARLFNADLRRSLHCVINFEWLIRHLLNLEVFIVLADGHLPRRLSISSPEGVCGRVPSDEDLAR